MVHTLGTVSCMTAERCLDRLLYAWHGYGRRFELLFGLEICTGYGGSSRPSRRFRVKATEKLVSLLACQRRPKDQVKVDLLICSIHDDREPQLEVWEEEFVVIPVEAPVRLHDAKIAIEGEVVSDGDSGYIRLMNNLAKLFNVGAAILQLILVANPIRGDTAKCSFANPP